MQSPASLAAHLRSPTQDQLAERLLHPSSMAAACTLLTLPQLQAGEAAAALGDRCTTARLAPLLGVPDDDPDLAAALRRLTGLALIWPQAGGLAAAHLNALWPHPLHLGPGAADLLVTRNMTELRRLAKLYGIPTTGRDKNELNAALAGAEGHCDDATEWTRLPSRQGRLSPVASGSPDRPGIPSRRVRAAAGNGIPAAISTTKTAARTQSSTRQNGGHDRVHRVLYSAKDVSEWCAARRGRPG